VIETVEQSLPKQNGGGLASVSVVLVTYNRASLLDSTIASVLRQTMRDFELLIADDASPDGTQEVCERWAEADRRIRYRRRAQNLGMPRNLNAAILASSGKYLAILHDDDVYSPHLLEKWKACLDEYPNAAFVFNAYRALDVQGGTRRIYREALPRCSRGSLLLENVFFRRWRFDAPVWGTVMIRRSAFDHAGSFDERFGYWADVDMWMRLAEEFDVCYFDEPLIAVTSGEAAPHQFEDSNELVQPLLERMFWEARMRHFRKRAARRFAEALRHCGFVAANRTWQFACAANRHLRKLRHPDPTYP
jgi:glycosyltransferase involved in cell wall biosynthesis